MKKLHFRFLLSFALLLSLGCEKEKLAEPDTLKSTSSARTSAETSVTPTIRIKSGHYLLIASDNHLPADLESQLQRLGGKLKSKLDQVGIASATSSDPAFAAKASLISGLRSVTPELSVQWFDLSKEKKFEVKAGFANPPTSGDDEFYDLQWGHDAIDSPEAWNAGYRGKGARVAILDGGFDLESPDLKPNINLSASKSFVPGEALQISSPFFFSHATAVAGLVAAADNGYGVIGVAPESELILIKVISDMGSGEFSWALQGIIHATLQGADVINMSFGGLFPRNGKMLDDNGTPFDPSDDFMVSDARAVQEELVAISRVTTFARQHGVTLIAAAGNSAIDGNKDQSLVHMPADAPGVISISATAPIGWAKDFSTNLDQPTPYSNFGTSLIDLSAPGGSFMYPGNEICTVAGVTAPCWIFDLVVSSGNGGGFVWFLGTSASSPFTAGVAALIIGKNGGQMDPVKVEAILRASADDLGKPGKDVYYGHGRVNAYRAVSQPY